MLVGSIFVLQTSVLIFQLQDQAGPLRAITALSEVLRSDRLGFVRERETTYQDPVGLGNVFTSHLTHSFKLQLNFSGNNPPGVILIMDLLHFHHLRRIIEKVLSPQ